MIKSTGSVYEVLCPNCQALIKHIHRLKRTEPGVRVRCRRCRRHSMIERVWLADGVWRMVALVATDVEACADV